MLVLLVFLFVVVIVIVVDIVSIVIQLWQCIFAHSTVCCFIGFLPHDWLQQFIVVEIVDWITVQCVDRKFAATSVLCQCI